MVINGIDTREISFVVQGALDSKITPVTIQSIRKNFPGSTIILSTWENSEIKNVDYDVLVLSKDCGSAVYDILGTNNNINRQLLSTQKGLKCVTTKFAAKVRSDLCFEDANFLRYFDAFPTYDPKYKKVRSRLVTLSLYTRFINISDNAETNINGMAFYVSDWFLFGYTKDVLEYYSAPLIDRLSEFSRYYLNKPGLRNKLPFPTLMSKLTPEQYICTHFFGRKNDDMLKLCSFDMNESQKYLINNFIVLNYVFSHIYSLKWPSFSKNEFLMSPFDSCGILFFREYQHLYKKWCDPSYSYSVKEYKVIKKSKIIQIWNFLLKDKINNRFNIAIKNVKGHFAFIKKILRGILPSYRVGCGIRDIFVNFSDEQRGVLALLHNKIDYLNLQVSKQNKEITMLKKKISEENERCESRNIRGFNRRSGSGDSHDQKCSETFEKPFP